MTEDGFIPALAARTLIRNARHGSLATLATEDGTPYASLASVATLPDGTPVTLISTLALHTRNAAADARASLLVTDGTRIDPLAGARVTLLGHLRPVEEAGVDLARRRFLARHPSAAGYATFKDFAFWRLDVERAHLVAGFGRINALTPADVLVDPALAGVFAENEAGAVAHMNEDHRDAIARYATVLLGLEAGDWTMTGADAYGIDMMTADGVRTARLDFPEPATAPNALHMTLVDLARKAKAQAAAA